MADLIRSVRVGPAFSRGCELAAEAMKKKGWSQLDLASRMRKRRGLEKTGSSHISRYLRGDRRPGTDAALAFFELLDVPMSTWREAARRKAA